MQITALDHVVLTVADVARTVRFYRDVLGVRVETFDTHRTALVFGEQKINLHPADAPYPPTAAYPTPGAIDLCLLTVTPISEVMDTLAGHGLELVEGPVDRTGANRPLRSVYVRDPDGNLIEIANRHEARS